MESAYQLGSERNRFLNGKAMPITFVVTEDCNLACKYCYVTGKNDSSAMSFEVAKKAVDYALENFKDQPGVIWDFMGGEPLLEIELIDKICDYIKKKMYLQDHHWFNNYSINITTNGLLYSEPKVQEFIKKNENKLSIVFSLDGNKKKHNSQRVKPDGSGSYEEIIDNVPQWLEQFPNATTKVTFASDDLKYLKDSIIHLWELGIKDVMANLVYEDVWKKGDEKILEKQMKELADYIIDNKLWTEYHCGLFDDNIGYPLSKERLKDNWCTAGQNMLAVDYKGDFYPCTRYLDPCLENKEPHTIGNVDEGINPDLLRPLLALDTFSQSPEKCIDCQVAAGFGWCQAFNYD